MIYYFANHSEKKNYSKTRRPQGKGQEICEYRLISLFAVLELSWAETLIFYSHVISIIWKGGDHLLQDTEEDEDDDDDEEDDDDDEQEKASSEGDSSSEDDEDDDDVSVFSAQIHEIVATSGFEFLLKMRVYISFCLKKEEDDDDDEEDEEDDEADDKENKSEDSSSESNSQGSSDSDSDWNAPSLTNWAALSWAKSPGSSATVPTLLSSHHQREPLHCLIHFTLTHFMLLRWRSVQKEGPCPYLEISSIPSPAQ